MPSGHIKVQKLNGHVFNIATPCHNTESVVLRIPEKSLSAKYLDNHTWSQ